MRESEAKPKKPEQGQIERPGERANESLNEIQGAREKAQDLMQSLRGLCRQERSALCTFLQGLATIEERRLHLELGYPNMFELCRLEFGLSEGCIYRRLQVARKLRSYPELLEALEQGSINLTLASLLCPHLGRHAWNELLALVAGQSKRAAQKALRDLDQSRCHMEKPSRVQYLGREQYSYRLKVPAPLHHQFERVKELLSHQIPDGDINEILAAITRFYLHKQDPQEKKAAPPAFWASYESPSRYIPRGLKLLLLERAAHQCQYQSPDGRRCTQKRYLDIDHIVPLAGGGQTKLDNLQVLCHAHNLLKGTDLPLLEQTNHNQFNPPTKMEAAPRPSLSRESMQQKFRRLTYR